MLIANPIYDVVFKYLMENLDIAKGIISTIIKEDIIHLDFQAKESSIKMASQFTLYHLDFIARIRDWQGKSKNVLIEMQKANILLDILRFRRYLGSQYRKEEEVIQPDGSSSKESLPIITIYFLGFTLSKTLPPIIKVNRQYIDVLNNQPIAERNDFIECLTHDSYVIQVKDLELEMKNRLEYILSIFKQEKFLSEDRRLKNYDHEIRDELLEKILKRLEMAAADNELLEKLENEELALRQYEKALGPYEHKIEKQEKIIEEKDKTIEEKDKAIEEKDKAIEEKDKTIEEKDKYIRELITKLEMDGKI